MNLLRSIFPLWSTSTSAMMVFTCSERPISRILSRRHWKWLQKHRGGRQPPFLSDCTQGFSTAEESLWSQEGRCFSEQFQNAQHFFLRATTISSILPCRKVWKPPSSLRWNLLEYPVIFVCVQPAHCFNEDLHPWGSTPNNGSHSFPLCPSEEILAPSKLPVLVVGQWSLNSTVVHFDTYLFVDLCKYTNLRNTAGQSDTVLRSNSLFEEESWRLGQFNQTHTDLILPPVWMPAPPHFPHWDWNAVAT